MHWATSEDRPTAGVGVCVNSHSICCDHEMGFSDSCGNYEPVNGERSIFDLYRADEKLELEDRAHDPDLWAGVRCCYHCRFYEERHAPQPGLDSRGWLGEGLCRCSYSRKYNCWRDGEKGTECQEYESNENA